MRSVARTTTEQVDAFALADFAAHPPVRRGEFSDLFGPELPRPRSSLFECGMRRGTTWSRNGTCRVAFTVHMSPDGHGVLTITDAASTAAVWMVALAATTQPAGGQRWWMCCPACGRRRAILYRLDEGYGRLGCRSCLRLCYTTQRLRPVARLAHRAHVLRLRVGCHLEDVPDSRPPRMHRRTFTRLMAKVNTIEDAELALWR